MKFISLTMCLVWLLACSERSNNQITPPIFAGTEYQGGEMTNGGTMSTNPQGGDIAVIDMVEEPAEPLFKPAPATLQRLSVSELKSSIQDIFGFVPDIQFEQDTSLHGFVRVANSELSLSPLFAEQLESFSWSVASQMIRDPQKLERWFSCPLHQRVEGLIVDQNCMKASILNLARQLWRRSMNAEEINRFTSLYELLRDSQFTEYSHQQGVAGIIAALIQSPDFVFRVEIGEPDERSLTEENGITWRYTNDEMATRLAYFLWGSSPDHDLLEAADQGLLTTDEGLRQQVLRLLSSPRTQQHFSSFFEEYLGLKSLAMVSKNTDLFPMFNETLRASMKLEVIELFLDAVFGESPDFRRLLTSEKSSVDRSLAQLYEVDFPMELADDERIVLDLPNLQPRGGLLGRAATLSLFSHATVNSPTFRGRFVRSSLLCQDVPPPPEGVIAQLTEPTDGEVLTLRQRLEQHAVDPQCKGCHQLMDPLGYPLEHFNPIGQWQVSDHGLPIDASGELDGLFLYGARELGEAVANSPQFSHCVTRRLYRYAVSHLETFDELPLLRRLTDQFMTDGTYQLQQLMVGIILSDGFRRLQAPIPEVDETGQEINIQGCGGIERCNLKDDDCDGQVDEEIIQTCQNSCGLMGIQHCENGQWQSCEVGEGINEICDGMDNDCDGVIDEDAAQSDEVCDGQDNDCDGTIDEEISSSLHEVPFATLTALHEACDERNSYSSHCNAAINRYCTSLGCGGTGFGPVEKTWSSALILCLPDTQVTKLNVSYANLAAQHYVCDGAREAMGPNCNASINRYCRSEDLTTGFGPLEIDAAEAQIACVPTADIFEASYTEISQLHDACSQFGERAGPNCNSAIHRFCIARSYRSGWGPLENSDDNLYIACVH